MSAAEEPLVLCGEPTSIIGTKPCPREKGHQDEHYCWAEGHIRVRQTGITVLTHAGERVLHLRMEGQSTPEEVCALVEYFEWLRTPEGKAALERSRGRRASRPMRTLGPVQLRGCPDDEVLGARGPLRLNARDRWRFVRLEAGRSAGSGVSLCR